jgi:hypothetical protein
MNNGFVYIFMPNEKISISYYDQRHPTSDRLYWSEHLFYSSLLKDFLIRTLQIKKAQLYYIPTFAYYKYANTIIKKQKWLFDDIVNDLNKTNRDFQYLWKHKRGDFVFFFSGDWGSCGIKDKTPHFMTHWGLQSPQKFMVNASMYKNNKNNKPCWKKGDIVVPPVNRDYKSKIIITTQNQTQCDFLFYGRRVSKFGPWCPSAEKSFTLCYSQGVRTSIFSHHINRSKFCISQQPIQKTSKFCLAPSGDGFRNRLTISMLKGCVPVIIQPKVIQPFESIIPYDRFSLRLSLADIPNLHKILYNISEEEYNTMLKWVRFFAPIFNWQLIHSYNLLKLELCRLTRQDCTKFESPLKQFIKN